MTTARELASRLRANLQGDESRWDTPLSGAASLDTAGPGSLSFLASGKYRRQLPHTRATALLVRPDDVAQAPASAALLVVEDPYLAYARSASLFSRAPGASGTIHPSAVVDASAEMGAGVTIDANAVIGAGCHIGDGCWIGPGTVLDERVRLGRGSRLMANVTLGYDVDIGEHCLIHAGAVIGSDGFGFAPGPDGWEKIAQLGSVRVGSHVEIGANTTIDRGAMADTVIEDGAIIDNLVHLAHNVRLGRGTALAAQVGVSGSTEIGAGCTVGGQAGFAGHINIAGGSHFTGQAMVTKGTREAGVYSSGWPAQPAREWRRTVARLRQLDEFERRLKALEGKEPRLQPSKTKEERE